MGQKGNFSPLLTAIESKIRELFASPGPPLLGPGGGSPGPGGSIHSSDVRGRWPGAEGAAPRGRRGGSGEQLARVLCGIGALFFLSFELAFVTLMVPDSPRGSVLPAGSCHTPHLRLSGGTGQLFPASATTFLAVCGLEGPGKTKPGVAGKPQGARWDRGGSGMGVGGRALAPRSGPVVPPLRQGHRRSPFPALAPLPSREQGFRCPVAWFPPG